MWSPEVSDAPIRILTGGHRISFFHRFVMLSVTQMDSSETGRGGGPHPLPSLWDIYTNCHLTSCMCIPRAEKGCVRHSICTDTDAG